MLKQGEFVGLVGRPIIELWTVVDVDIELDVAGDTKYRVTREGTTREVDESDMIQNYYGKKVRVPGDGDRVAVLCQQSREGEYYTLNDGTKHRPANLIFIAQ